MIRRHSISFQHAFDGLRWALRTQPNYKIHLTLAIISIVTGLLLQISRAEMLLIIALIFIGLAIETINTALEKTADAISKDYHEDIKIAKDVAAGAMLFFAVGAVLVAIMIFLPKFLYLVLTVGT